MTNVAKTGKLDFVRVNDVGLEYGPPTDAIHCEVVGGMENDDVGFGFTLRTGDGDLPARLGMLSLLRDARINGRDVTVWIDLPQGRKNGRLYRVQL